MSGFLKIYHHGISVEDVSGLIYSLSEISESLYDEGEFVIPDFSFEIDNTNNWLDHYNGSIKGNDVFIEVGYDDNDSLFTLFFGRLANTTPAVDFSRQTVKFKAVHIIEDLKREFFQLSTGQDDWKGSTSILVPKNFGLNQTFQYSINGIYPGPKGLLDDMWWSAPYFYNETDLLSFLGDILRSYGSALVWKNNKFHFKDLASIQHGVVNLKESQVIGIKSTDVWGAQKRGIKISSLDTRSGHTYITKTEGISDKEKNILDIEAGLLANTYIRTTDFLSTFTPMRYWVLKKYEDFFLPERTQTTVEFDGLNVWIGDIVPIRDTLYLVEKTRKNVETEITESDVISLRKRYW